MGMFAGDKGKRALGIISDGLLGFLGKPGVYAPAMMQQQRQQADHQQAMELARIKATTPDPTDTPSIIRTLQAAGIDPQSPQGRSIIERNLAQPRFMTLGNPEMGQTVINPDAAGGGMSRPPPQAIEQLRANPASAQQFDEIFGPGASARILGGGM